MTVVYTRGTVLHLRAQFTDLDGDPIDPDVVELVVRVGVGDRETITYTVAVDSPITRVVVADDPKFKDGPVYQHDLQLNESGPWAYGWVSTGAGAATFEAHFDVLASDLLP